MGIILGIILGTVVAVALLACSLLPKCFSGAAVAVQGCFHNSLLTHLCWAAAFAGGFSSLLFIIWVLYCCLCVLITPEPSPQSRYISTLNAELLHIPGSCRLRNSQFILKEFNHFSVAHWVLSGLGVFRLCWITKPQNQLLLGKISYDSF